MLYNMIRSLFCVWTVCATVYCRDARDDICSRIPWFSTCKNAQMARADQPQSPSIQDQSNQLCQQFKSTADSNCNGHESGRMKEHCDTYKRNCLFSSSDDQDLDKKIDYCNRYASAYIENCIDKEPTGRVAVFCYAYKDYCGSIPKMNGDSQSQHDLSSAEINQLCNQYAWTANRSCWGFEEQKTRSQCNQYRVYCQGKDPVPSVDGSFELTKDSWGVAGLPFYPFNQQGAISGGERNNVGFGDWGANFKQRKGVTDFWDTNKQVGANWQQGNYAYNRGWNVPLVGIGGYRNNDVNVGGLFSPSENTGNDSATNGGSQGLLSGLGNILGK